MAETTYEVNIRMGGEWKFESRYGEFEKDEAIEEAKRVSDTPGVEAVKVIKETYDAARNATSEQTVFSTSKLASVGEEYGALAGDIDLDGDVDFSDFSVLAAKFTGTLGPGEGDKTRSDGDFDGDADVDFGDFSALAANFTGPITAPGSHLPAARSGDLTPVRGIAHHVPEPATLILLAAGGLLVLPRRRVPQVLNHS